MSTHDMEQPMVVQKAAEQEEVDVEKLRLQCLSYQLKLNALAANAETAEAVRQRANSDLQLVAARMDTIRKDAQAIQQSVAPLYQQLRQVMNCPQDKEINLETGEFVDPPQPPPQQQQSQN